MQYTIVSNKRFLIIGKRPQYRTFSIEMYGDGSALVEFDIQSVQHLNRKTAEALVEPFSIEHIAPVQSIGKGLFNEYTLMKAYWRILLEDRGEEKLVSDRIKIESVSSFLSKPSWGKKDYWNANKLQYILAMYCNLSLEIFPQVYKRFRKKKHKYLIASQKRKR